MVLIFPPRSSPTYAPLGCATLAGASAAAGGVLSVLDLNLRLWERLAAGNPAGAAALGFMRGQTGDFYAEDQYLGAQPAWQFLAGQVTALQEEARHFAETGELSTALGAWLAECAADIHSGAGPAGFSVLFPEQLDFALALAKYLHERCAWPGALVLGGATAAAAVDAAELLTAFPFISGIVAGEGEPAILALARGGRPEEMPGFVSLDAAGGLRKNPAVPPAAAAIHPVDYSWSVPAQYANPAPILSLSASRGCAWHRCRFCAHNLSFGNFRQRPAESLVLEMAACCELFGCRHFYLADQYVPAQALDEISAAIICAGLDCRFHIMARPVADYTPDVLGRAYRAGCRWISWGVESGSPRLLQAVNKGITPQTAAQVLNDSHGAGISNLAMMIFGLPGSGSDDFEKTAAWLAAAMPAVDAMTASSFVLFSDTVFGRRPERWGLQALGRERLFRTSAGREVHSGCLHFRRQGEAGSEPSPLGRQEIEAWERRRAWLGGRPFLENLPCEHFLLYSSRRADLRDAPIKPFTPKPVPRRLPLAG